MSNHPFSLSFSQLKQIWQGQDQPNIQRFAQQTTDNQSNTSYTNIPLDNQIKVVTMDSEGEINLDKIPPGTATTLAIGEEGGAFVTEDNQVATTLAIGEEGGTFVSDNNQVATTLAIGEEGGLFITDQRPAANPPMLDTEVPLMPDQAAVPTTLMVGEEGGLIPENEGFASTLAIGEEGGSFPMDELPVATTLMIGEEGGAISDNYPVAVTATEGADIFSPQTTAVNTLSPLHNSDDISLGGIPITHIDPKLEPPLFDENLYLQRYPEIQDAVNKGVIISGQEHFSNWGQAEGRSGGAFNEGIYRQLYPQVLGNNQTGLEHYLNYGKNENRVGVFTGHKGNDFITAFGNMTIVSGVNLLAYDGLTGQVTVDNDFASGQADILHGGTGIDRFILGTNPHYFYVGEGNNDYAQINNFDVTQDQIQLAGSIDNYHFDIINNSTNISMADTKDLVAIVKDVPSLLNSNLVFG